jgi:hypothetical protein
VYDPTRPDFGPTAEYVPALVAPPRRRWGRTVWFIAGLVVLGCCVAGVTASVVGQALEDAAADRANQPAPTIGAAVHDGKFEFVVTAVSCGHGELVNGILRAQAQGQFCVVDLTVTNVGDEARTFADGVQKAFGPDGDQYSADTHAGVVANGSGAAIWNVINPGNTVAAKVVFDIPAGSTIAAVELHDSLLSGGVRVGV